MLVISCIFSSIISSTCSFSDFSVGSYLVVSFEIFDFIKDMNFVDIDGPEDFFVSVLIDLELTTEEGLSYS